MTFKHTLNLVPGAWSIGTILWQINAVSRPNTSRKTDFEIFQLHVTTILPEFYNLP